MRKILAFTAFAVFVASGLNAQTVSVSQVSGTIQDQSGAAVPGAQVQITNVDTGAVRTTQSNDQGAYILPNLEIGPYKLQVTKEGFETFVQSGIVLQVNTNPEINVTLQVGAATQTVEVQANAAMVETQSTGIGQVIQPEQVVDLPLNDRQANQLILLSGGAVNNNTGALVINLDYPNTVAISINGSQGNATNYYLDGAVNMAVRTNTGLPMPFPDALQEFKVESSALPANAGSRPGGSVNAITKSGTNSFHGNLFEFLRNTDFDARVDFTGLKDGLKRSQFGGTLGGPVKRDKLFFFTGFQGTIERIQGAPTEDFVPTAATLTGNFQAMLAPPCQTTPVTLNSAYTTAPGSNIIQPTLMNTPSALVAKKMASYLPTPINACGAIFITPYTHDNEFQGVSRVDWQRTQNDTIFGRYFITDYFLLPFYAPGNLLSAINPGLRDRAQSVDIGDTHVLSANTISSLRVSFSRTAVFRSSAPGIPTWTSVGSNVTSEVPNYVGNASVTGYFSFAIPSFPGYDYENIFGISETISMNRGAHQFIFGFSGIHNQMNDDGESNLNPAIGFASGAASYTGNALADYLTGNADSFRQANGQIGRDGQNAPSLFFEDNWKVTRTFQLNLGLRWDPFYPQHAKYKYASDFSLAGFQANQVSKVYVNAPPGLTFPGDAGFNGTSDTNARPLDFAPRIGLVWDPRGKGMETIRAGYGMFYDTSILWNAQVIVLNQPWGASNSFTPLSVAQGAGLANPWSGQPNPNPFPTPLNPPANYTFPLNGGYSFDEQNIKAPNVQEWNLSFQKQMGANWLVSAGYIGSKSTHQWLGENLDYAQIITAGETAPGIVSTAGMTGTSGPCTLFYGGTSTANEVTFSQCNSASTVSAKTNGGVTVSNENARKGLVLLNPTYGPYFGGGLTQNESIANATYNGLLLSVQHRLSQNFSLLANYTWSHCLDDGEEGENITATFQNPANPRADWGNCASDRRQIFNTSLVLSSPKYHSPWVNRIAGYWQASGIFTAQSGSWLNVTDGTDVSLTGVGNDRPDQVANPYAAGAVSANPTCVAPSTVHTLASWFNPCAFVKTPAGTFGTLGRDSLLGPGNWDFDTAIWRTFPLGETWKLDFRAEAFNVLNHLQLGAPGSALSSAGTLAKVTSVPTGANARLLQFALKLTF